MAEQTQVEIDTLRSRLGGITTDVNRLFNILDENDRALQDEKQRQVEVAKARQREKYQAELAKAQLDYNEAMRVARQIMALLGYKPREPFSTVDWLRLPEPATTAIAATRRRIARAQRLLAELG